MLAGEAQPTGEQAEPQLVGRQQLTWLDRLERDLITGYEKDVATVLGLLSPLTLETAVELLSLPDRIRGYGPVKAKSVQDAKIRYAELANDLVNPPPVPRQIAAE